MKVHGREFDDNCHELQTLRWFRDHHVSEEDVNHYYQIAPTIVARIDSLPYAEDIFRSIYQDVAQVCVDDSESNQYAVAYSIYKNAVLKLEQEYLLS